MSSTMTINCSIASAFRNNPEFPAGQRHGNRDAWQNARYIRTTELLEYTSLGRPLPLSFHAPWSMQL